jgi:hypothetical protein
MTVPVVAFCQVDHHLNKVFVVAMERHQMFNKTTLQAILAVWVIWHLLFGLLATFLPDIGSRITGWSPQGGWTADMLSLSSQYGMVMVLLALTYGIALADPLRYIGIVWVAIAEQALGIGYALYIYFGIGGVTVTQVGIQSVVNVAFIAVFVTFWLALRGSKKPTYA